MRAAGDQAKTACGNLQLCTGLNSGIKGATHSVGQRKLERVQRRRQEREETETLGNKDESDRMAVGLHNLIIETAGTEEEAEERLREALKMEVNR